MLSLTIQSCLMDILTSLNYTRVGVCMWLESCDFGAASTHLTPSASRTDYGASSTLVCHRFQENCP